MLDEKGIREYLKSCKKNSLIDNYKINKNDEVFFKHNNEWMLIGTITEIINNEYDFLNGWK